MKRLLGRLTSRFRPPCAQATTCLSRGQVPVIEGRVVEGGIAAETRAVLENVRAALSLAGCEMSDVVKTTVWLRDRADFAAFNTTYAEFFPQDPPARSTAESRLMIDIAVEIEAVAYKPL